MKKESPLDIVKACRAMGEQLQQAAAANNIALNGDSWIDYRPIAPEVNNLRDAFNRLSFSDAYKQWGKARRQALAKDLAADSEFRGAAQNWPDLSERERLAQIRKLGKRLMSIYSNGGRLFPPRPATLAPYRQGRSGEGSYFERGRATKGLLGRTTVSLNTHEDAGFGDFYKAMDSAFHENLHAVQFSLMDYFPSCPAGHKLGQDMEMLHYSCRAAFERAGRILPLYHAIPWERDTHHHAKHFVRDLREALHRHDTNANARSSTPPAPR